MFIKTSSKKVISENPDGKEVCVYCGRPLKKQYNNELKRTEYSCICQYFHNHCEMNLELFTTNVDFERSGYGELEYEMYLDYYHSIFNYYQMKDRLIQIDEDCKMITTKGDN